MGNRILGHNVENRAIVDATITVGAFAVNSMGISMVLEERNKGINGMNASETALHSKVTGLGSKGSLIHCRCEVAVLIEHLKLLGPWSVPLRASGFLERIFRDDTILLSSGFPGKSSPVDQLDEERYKL